MLAHPCFLHTPGLTVCRPRPAAMWLRLQLLLVSCWRIQHSSHAGTDA